MKTIDPLQLQRLVDGRLDSPAISGIISLAEEHPRLWRDIGGAFVEDRIFKTAIGEFADEQLTTRASDENVSAAKSPAPETQKNRGARSAFGFPALAAAILLSLTAGLLGGWYLDSVSPPAIAVNENLIDYPAETQNRTAINESPQSAKRDGPGDGLANAESEPAATTLVDYRPDYHLDLQDAQGQHVLGGEVPLYTLKNAERLGYRMDDNRIPDGVLSRAQESGYQCDQDVHYISGSLADGRRFIVPVRTLNIASGQ